MITQALAETVAAVRLIMPIDLVELLKALFLGIASLCVPVSTVIILIVNNRQKKQEVATTAVAATVAAVSTELSKVKDNVDLVERNTNSMTSTIRELARKAGVAEGEAAQKIKGAETAATLAEGRQLGMDEERASVAASGAPSNAAPAAAGKAPLPVEDNRTATAGEHAAGALEKSADAQQRIATVAGEKPKPK